MTDPRDGLDEQWCAHQDALALGEQQPAPSHPPGSALADAWADELAFYEALATEAGGHPEQPLAPEDLALVDAVLARDAARSPTTADVDRNGEDLAWLDAGPARDAAWGSAATDGDRHHAPALRDDAAPIAEASANAPRSSAWRWGVALLAVAAAVVLSLVLLTPDLGLRASAGTWVAQQDRSRVELGESLPLAVWLVAEDKACGELKGASVCAEQGSVIRIHRKRGRKMTLELRQGSVTVRGAIDVSTAAGTLQGDDGSHYDVRLDEGVVEVAVHGGALQVLEPSATRSLGEGESLRLGEAPAPAAPAVEASLVPEPSPAAEPAAPEPEASADSNADPDPQPTPRSRRPSSRSTPPADPGELLSRARTLRGQGDRRGAARAYASLIDAHPGSTEAQAARVSLGQLRLRSKKYRAALALFRRYRKGGGPLAEEALWGEIQALAGLGREQALGEAVEELARRFPRSVYRNKAEELSR